MRLGLVCGTQFTFGTVAQGAFGKLLDPCRGSLTIPQNPLVQSRHHRLILLRTRRHMFHRENGRLLGRTFRERTHAQIPEMIPLVRVAMRDPRAG